jgi:hypothetical protein
MFKYESNAVNFYQHITNNEEHKRVLDIYTTELAEQLPVKFK